jgi:hypothetical protein
MPTSTKLAECRLGPTSTVLTTNSTVVLDYLRRFHTVTDRVFGQRTEAKSNGWTVEAIVDKPDPGMAVNPWGVGHTFDESTRILRLRCADQVRLAITTRKCVREALVDYCEQRRYAMLHASAVADARRLILVVGDKGSGKTTLALRALLDHDMRYLSNDHLIIFPAGPGPSESTPLTSRLVVTALPTFIPVKIGTYMDLERRLPPPYDPEGLDLATWRQLPRQQRHASDQRVLYTFGQLGQASPATVNLGDHAFGPQVVVALVSYTDAPAASITPVDDPVAALMPHIRTDWMFDPNLNQRYLPRRERSPAECLHDAYRLVTALSERATVVRFTHHGTPIPLLDAFSGG